MKLATIEIIKRVEKHPNADALDICEVLNFRAIVKLNQFKVGDKILFVQPDCVLPDKEWAAFYKSKSNRIKAIKLRNIWSEGVVESLNNVGLNDSLEVGSEVSELLGITHYEPPIPQELNAKCALRFGLTKTDEERFNNLEIIPYGEEVIVTLKIDGASASYGCRIDRDNNQDTFIASRQLELKPECVNNYTSIEKKYNILAKLMADNKSLCLRGEIYGVGIQSSNSNPHSKLPLDFAAFNLFNLDTMEYESFNKCVQFCDKFGIPTVPIIERAILTPELIKKYSEDLVTINNQPFEGVVMKLNNGKSFKVINKNYDSKK